MLKEYFENSDSRKAWKFFVKKFELNLALQDLFFEYLNLIKKTNKNFNITAIEKDAEIINYHFCDSLYLTKDIFFSKESKIILDVGSGAGFPGIPLALFFPKKKILLLESSKKKCEFLNQIVLNLNLKNVEIINDDWRNFLRNFDLKIDFFLARASLSVSELLRIYKPSSFYKNSILVYWASKEWFPEKKEKQFIHFTKLYKVGFKERKLIFFKNI